MTFLLLAQASVALALAQPPVRPAAAIPPETAVTATLEDLRKGELFLDAATIEPIMAASFCGIEGGARICGAFAYLEPIRRMRERGAEVKELRFEEKLVQVFGASAIATYRYAKSWRDRGALHREQGSLPAPLPAFRHGAGHVLPGGVRLVDSYHVSQQNTFIGRLTPAMFDEVLRTCRRLAGD